MEYPTRFAVIITALLIACILIMSASAETPAEPNARLIEANLRFGFELFNKLVETKLDGNVFISPFSISMALTMTYNGAAGDTRKAMADALGIENLTYEEINESYSMLIETLENANPKVELAIGNSLWGREGIEFDEAFLDRNRKYFDAEIAELDFRSPDAVKSINDWVGKATNGKINRIIERINPLDILFLINAIYFKGDWTAKFDEAETKVEDFTLPDGNPIQVPMMSRRGRYRYFETETFQAISLPYGEERISMYVFLPKENSSLPVFIEELTAENWGIWMSSFGGMKGTIKLPRFKVEYDATLNDQLKALGMEIAFDAILADFGAMTPEDAYIGEVLHKRLSRSTRRAPSRRRSRQFV